MKLLNITKERKVQLLESISEVEAFFKEVDETDSDLLTWDWETTGLEYDAIPLGLSMHQRGHDPVFVPVDFFFSKGIPMSDLAQLCNKWFPKFRLIAHNAKYDSMINKMNGIKDECCNIYVDTLIMIHLYDPSLDKQLEKRVAADFGYEKPTFEKICGKKWTKINWHTEGDELLDYLAGYAGEDTYWETKMYYKYKSLLDEDAWRILFEIEMPMIKILRDAKIRGVKIDVPLLLQMEREVKPALERYVNDIYEEAGCIFNLNSPKQKKEIFFKKMRLPIISLTKKGEPSTDAYTYEQWADKGIEIGKRLLKYSELNKLYTGYIKAIPTILDDDAVLRGDINSCGTETGRASSSNPNLQNQPNNSDFPIRCAFIPRQGYAFVNKDYSQLELRVMAHMSKDKHFTEVFRNGEDPHGDVAKRLGIPRKGAKVVNFGVLYGMGPDKLANTIDVPVPEAKRIIQVDYMKTYSGFARWKEQTENFAKRNGYVKNLFGRRRLLPEATKDRFHRDTKKFYGALRQSVNTIIQGTGADIVKLATIAMCRKFEELGLDAHFLLQVHDEVLIEARIDQIQQVEQIVIDCMVNTVLLDVPLEVDGKILLNWGEAKMDDVPSLTERFDYSLYSGLLCAV